MGQIISKNRITPLSQTVAHPNSPSQLLSSSTTLSFAQEAPIVVGSGADIKGPSTTTVSTLVCVDDDASQGRQGPISPSPNSSSAVSSKDTLSYRAFKSLSPLLGSERAMGVVNFFVFASFGRLASLSVDKCLIVALAYGEKQDERLEFTNALESFARDSVSNLIDQGLLENAHAASVLASG